MGLLANVATGDGYEIDDSPLKLFSIQTKLVATFSHIPGRIVQDCPRRQNKLGERGNCSTLTPERQPL